MSNNSASTLGIPQFKSQYGNPGQEAIIANKPENLRVVQGGGASQVEVSTPNASETRLAELFAQSAVQSQNDAVGGKRRKRGKKIITKMKYKKHIHNKSRKSRKSRKYHRR